MSAASASYFGIGEYSLPFEPAPEQVASTSGGSNGIVPDTEIPSELELDSPLQPVPDVCKDDHTVSQSRRKPKRKGSSYERITKLVEESVRISGLVSFTCCICKDSISRRNDLRRHLVTHDKVLMNCPTCGYGSFGRKDALKRHHDREHAEIPWVLVREFLK